ncbi:hypothetical protein DTO271D3_4922 [Paecilomyces variotii]|nr:hypothetical protein DTO271D3_4922 [Paecilomyces variotii]
MFAVGVLATILFFLQFLLKYVIYPVYISPLAKIPNAHFTAPVLPIWIWWKRRCGTEIRTIHALHQRHGTIVRLGPNELSVNSVRGLKIIYKGAFDKDRWYRDVLKHFGMENLVSMMEYTPHSLRRNILANVYSKSYLQSSRDFRITSSSIVLDKLLPALEELAQSKTPVNVLSLMQAASMDFMSGYLFGAANGTDFIRHEEYRNHWLGVYSIFKRQDPRDRLWTEIERFCFSLCEKTGAWLHAENGERENPIHGIETDPVVYKRLSEGLQSMDLGFTPMRQVIASEMLSHLLASVEKSGVTLTYLIWQMSRDRSLQARLRQELLGLLPALSYPSQPLGSKDDDSSRLPPTRDINALPLLNAIVQETLRLHCAVPGLQRRVTPSTIDTMLEGYEGIPGGVKVSSSAYILHRNPDAFPDPERWLPERWLEPTEDMRRFLWAFSNGERMCLGKDFALQEIKLVVAAIYTNYTTTILDDEGIEQEDSYLGSPRSNKLIIEVRPA